jgi:predicted DsbA family dithiol-disulfide isomerase
MTSFVRLISTAGALALLSAGPALAEFSASQRGDIERIIREYIVSHPEVLQEAMMEYEKRAAAAQAARAQSAVKEHAKQIFNSEHQVVLKEFPVLSPGSVEAAKVATAARMQDKTGKKYLEFHQKLLGGRGQADKAHAMAVAKDVGFDMARIEKDMNSDEVRATLEESRKLADALGLNGTPSYVIGNDVVIGAVGLATLREKVNTARCGKPAC